MIKLKYVDGDSIHGIKVINLYDSNDRRKCTFICPICNKQKTIFRNRILQNKVKSCGCNQHRKREWKSHKFLDLSGQIFGDLHVIQRDFTRPEKVNFLCRCKCGKVKSIFSHYLTSGKSKTCGCSKHFTGEKSNSWKGCGDITGHYFAHIRSQARIRKLKFDLTVEDLWELFEKQKKQCNLSGVPIELFVNREKIRTASLDRIDNSKGYTIDNVQWVHKDINYMKRILSQEQFINYCNLVVIRYPIVKNIP